MNSILSINGKGHVIVYPTSLPLSCYLVDFLQQKIAMAQIANMEAQTEIKCSAKKFYEIFRSKVYLVPKICPNLVKDIQLL
jgi:hypothetical protein